MWRNRIEKFNDSAILLGRLPRNYAIVRPDLVNNIVKAVSSEGIKILKIRKIWRSGVQVRA